MDDLIIRLRPEPSAVPVMVRLRRALKHLHRAHGLRCVNLLEIPETHQVILGPHNRTQHIQVVNNGESGSTAHD
jgi:hypothetical protein